MHVALLFCCSLPLVHFLLLQHRSTGYSPQPTTGHWWPASLGGCASSSMEHLLPTVCPLAISPTMFPSASPASPGCCYALNTCEQMCHQLLKLGEVLVHTGVFTLVSKLAGSSCDWHRAVPDLLSYNLLPCSQNSAIYAQYSYS